MNAVLILAAAVGWVLVAIFAIWSFVLVRRVPDLIAEAQADDTKRFKDLSLRIAATLRLTETVQRRLREHIESTTNTR